MKLDNKAREAFEIITRTFDQVESDLEDGHKLGETDEKEYAMSRAAVLKERVERLCDEVAGFREELDRRLRGV